MLRVSATRAASIWVLVIQARSKVWRANSPNAMRVLRVAVPAREPRCILRCFTRLGIKGIRKEKLKGQNAKGKSQDATQATVASMDWPV